MFLLNELVFISNDHIVYENGNNISGHCYGEWRQLRIRKMNGHVYRFSIIKLRPGNLREIGKAMHPTAVMLTEQENGYLRFTEQNKELLVWLHNNKIKAVRWHDENRVTHFIKAPGKKLQQAVSIPLDVHLALMQKESRNGLIERYQSILQATEINGDATVETASYYLYLGQSFFRSSLYREAKEAFTLCSMTLLFNHRSPWHETIYWFGRVNEVEGNNTEARQFYYLAIERYREGEGLVTREKIQIALNRVLG